MWEDAATIELLGVKVYAFGLYAAVGTGLGLLVLALLLRRFRWKKGTAALTGALAILCGFVLSRLLFGGLDNSLGAPLSMKGLLLVTGGGYSMMGALLGASLGAVIAARATKQSAARLMDFLAPALLAFIVFERLGEGCVEEFGISRPLEEALFKDTFLAVKGRYESYLATYLIEAALALVFAIVLLRDVCKARRPGDSFLLFLMLFGGSQVVMESLRFDHHMYWSFVGFQQIIAFIMLAAGVAALALRQIRKRRALAVAALTVLLLSLGVCICMEFALDRTTASRYLIYGAFILAVSAPIVLGILLRKEAKA